MEHILTKFELDYAKYTLGIFDVTGEDEISYSGMIMKKVNKDICKVSTLGVVIFEGKWHECLRFIEDNYNEFYKCVIPYCKEEVRPENVVEYLRLYKSYLFE